MTDICFFVLLDFLALEVGPSESCVIAMIFNWDFMLEVFGRRLGFFPYAVSAYSGMIQGQLYPT